MAKEQNIELNEDFLRSRGEAVFNASKVWREGDIEDRWLKNNDLYDSRFRPGVDGKRPSDVLIGRGQLFIPKTYSHTQRIHTDVMDAFFFDQEEIVNIGSWKSVPRETREIVKALLNYRLNNHPVNFYQEMHEATLDGLKVGVGVVKIWPKLTTETKTDGEGNEREDVVDYHPVIEALPYEDVFFSSNATWKDYWKFPIVHRFKKSLDYLERRGYKNLDQIEVRNEQETNDPITDQRKEHVEGSPFSRPNVEVEAQNEPIVFEIWDFLDVDGDGKLQSCSWLMAGDAQGPKVIIRDVEANDLPYRHPGEDYNRPPFVVGVPFPEPHLMNGKSLPENVEHLQRETNSLRNQSREATALALRRPILADRNSGIDLMALVNRKIGSVVLTNDTSPASIRELDISPPTTASIQEQARTDQDFFEVTSVPPDLQGLATLRDDTATAVNSRVANANRKIERIIRNYEITLFLMVFEMLLRLEQTYETDEFIEMVTGRVLGWRFLDDDVPLRTFIQGEFELKVNTGISKQQQINKFFMMLDRAGQVNQATAAMVGTGVADAAKVKFIDTTKIYEQILTILGEKRMDDFTFPAQRPPQLPPGQQPPGMASQARLPGSATAETQTQNPELQGVSALG